MAFTQQKDRQSNPPSPPSVESGWRSIALQVTARLLQRLPKGRSTIFRWVWRCVGSPDAFIGRFQGVNYAVRPKDAATSLTPFLFQEYEPLIASVFSSILKPGGIFIDVGANIGLVSLLAARTVGPNGRVISYEPLPQNIADINRIRQNYGCSERHWEIVPVALSDRAGTCQFDFSGEAGWCRIDDRGALEISTRILDDELSRLNIEHIDLVKVDVEGHEASVIKGMRASLESGKISAVLLELHVPDVTESEIDEIVGVFSQCGMHPFQLVSQPLKARVLWREIDLPFRPAQRTHMLFNRKNSGRNGM
jgi:FkbM family methyltransferase